MLAMQTADAAEVSCVILPLRAAQLVVPSVCVAEVLPWRTPVAQAGTPQWCAGTLNWHGALVPVLDQELLMGAADPAGPISGRCLAVLNRTTAQAAWPFYALVLNGIPRLVQVAQVDLAAESGPEGAGELLRVRVGTELLVIPDLADLEARVAGLISAGAAEAWGASATGS